MKELVISDIAPCSFREIYLGETVFSNILQCGIYLLQIH